MADVKDIATYSFASESRLFFDTNVWLFICGPQGGPADPKVKTYSLAQKKAANAKSTIFIDSHILSEFANRSARMKYSILGGAATFGDFKSFRKSADFKDFVETNAAVLRNIVADSVLVDYRLELDVANRLLTRYASGNHDFNDLLIMELCGSLGLTLVTDDGDFGTSDIEILTVNPALLRSTSAP